LPNSYNKSVNALIDTAEYFHRNDLKVPVDILSRLLEAGIDISQFN